ncbi:MED4 isoform 1, partial [Pan troglodytes]
DPRRPYPTDLEMRSGLLGQMNNPSTNGVNGHLPGDALAAGRLPDVLAPQYPWQSNDMSMNMLPPNHSSDFLLEPPGHNKENEDDVEIMSTDSSSSSKMEFHHVGQTGSELLTSSDPPTSASQSAGITGVSHRAWQEPSLLSTEDCLINTSWL